MVVRNRTTLTDLSVVYLESSAERVDLKGDFFGATASI
jgi:hypothetical protein